MKSIPIYNLKIEINDLFIETATFEILVYKKLGFFKRINYDFKRLPILNFLDKSHYKYIINFEREAFKRKTMNPMDLIEKRIKEIRNIIKQNILSNLIKQKQYKIVAHNVEFCNTFDILNLFQNTDYTIKQMLINELKMKDKNHPVIFNLLNNFSNEVS